MDEFVKVKLAEWDLENLQADFQRNQIDEDIFNNLEEKDIQELIPVLGLRKKFMIKYQIYSLLRHDSKSDTDTVSTVSDQNSSNVSTESLSVIPTENRETAFCGLQDINRSLGREFPDFNLKTLLKTSAFGKTILNYYKQNNILDDSNRSRLIDIIIKHIYNYIITHRLKHDQYLLLCSKVTDLFPRESSSTYYIPYVPKREAGASKGILAKGRLVDKARNLLYQSGDTVKCKVKRKLDAEAGEGPSSVKPCVPLHEDIKESITFLKHFNEPWDEVIKNWKNTANFRKNSQKDTVEAFLSEWPILNDLRAEQLINLDFDFYYGRCGLNLLNNWCKFIDTIIGVAGTTKIRDKEVLSNYSEICDERELSDDSKVFCQINLLCHMIPPKGRIKITRNDCWKFTIIECIESIIIQSSTAGDVEKTINKQKEKALLRKQHVQPYLLIVGTSFKDIQSVFVVVDTIRYQFNSVIIGLDTLFKIFHVFNAKYPVQSEHIWTLVQQAIFKIKTIHDKEFPYTMYLLKALEEEIIT